MSNSCWTTAFVVKVHYRLRVEDESPLVQRIADAPHPAELLELALDPEPLGRSLGDVVEDDHRTLIWPVCRGEAL